MSQQQRARIKLREGYATHIYGIMGFGIDIHKTRLAEPTTDTPSLLGKAITLPRHAYQQTFALDHAREPVA